MGIDTVDLPTVLNQDAVKAGTCSKIHLARQA